MECAGKRTRTTGVKCAEYSNGVQLFRFEETGQLGFGVFVAVGSVADVRHHIRAVVATDCPLGRLPGIGRSQQVAHPLHDVISLQRHDNNRARAHELLDLGVKWFRSDVRVVFPQQRRRQAHHLAAHDGKAGGFKTIEHVSDVALRHAVGLKNDECSLHISSRPYFQHPV